jgi:hypothetical protein
MHQLLSGDKRVFSALQVLVLSRVTFGQPLESEEGLKSREKESKSTIMRQKKVRKRKRNNKEQTKNYR